MKTLRLTLALAVVALGVVAATHASSQAGFTPKLIAGTWKGKWNDTRFHTTGAIKIVGKALSGNKKLQFTTDFGGGVFGCADPKAEKSKVLTKGSGYNHWSSSGFKMKGPSNSFGITTLVYSYSAKTLKGSGHDPPCRRGIKWTVSGKFSGNKFTGKTVTTLEDGSKAPAILTASK